MQRFIVILTLALAPTLIAQERPIWKIHDAQRPNPEVVTPGDAPGAPPSDAIVLFDGTDTSQWQHADGSPVRWKLENGYLECARAGDIFTKQAFGDCQLHIEWATAPGGTSQGAGNSGVFLMGKYEVQVLNSYENRTYADGQAGAVYTQYPPMVNASRPPQEWQTYDIVFRAPRFNDDGSLRRAATLTVLHNGVLIQDHVRVNGPTSWMERKPYEKHDAKLPLKLQDHANPNRFRNIWIREIGPRRTMADGPDQPRDETPVTLTQAQIDAVLGVYSNRGGNDRFLTISVEDGKLMGHIRNRFTRELFALSPTEFFFKEVEAPLVLDVDANGNVTGGTMTVGIDPKPLVKE